ncbi:TPA: alpha/beta hydrolase [Burkholderia cenocepacia]|nr:alpha/beta hydrolase [Burkholderia cenocepacia]
MKGEQALERRVTAGLRGASWNPALVPSDMRTTVYPGMTADGALVTGYLHARGGERTVIFIMHPRELLVTHYMVPGLVAAGYACWVQGPRSTGNDVRLEHEMALHEVASGMVKLKELGFERIVMLGNSGGASLFAYYNQQAQLEGGRRIERTPGGRPTKLADAPMPVPDGFVFLAPHPGQGILLMNMIDPSLTDEGDPFSVSEALNPFSDANGYRDGKSGGAKYAPEFVERYRLAQRERVAKIDVAAKASIAERIAQKKRLVEADGGDAYRAAFSGLFHVWRTDADLRCFDLSIDSSERRWGSVWGANPSVSNMGSVSFARVCTPESWLSTWSGLSSRASFAACGSSIEQPALVIYYTGDNSVFPGDVANIFSSLGSGDKARIDIRGNHHGQSLRMDEKNGQDIATECAAKWLTERYPVAA